MTIWKLQEFYRAGKLTEMDQPQLLTAQKLCADWQEHFGKVNQSAITTYLYAKGVPETLMLRCEELDALTVIINQQLKTRYGCDD